MKFSDFVCPEAIRADLKAEDKQGAIRAMARSLLEAGKIPEADFEGIVRSVLLREELGTTGIGHAVAVPHAKHASVDRLVGTIAISPAGVEFEAIDGDKVHLLFLLISPPDRPGDHLRALESITRQLKRVEFRKALTQARTEEVVRKLLDDADHGKFTA